MSNTCFLHSDINFSKFVSQLDTIMDNYCKPYSNRIYVVHYPTPDGSYRELVRFNSWYFGLKYFHFYQHDNSKALLQIIECDGSNNYYFRRSSDGQLCLTKSPYYEQDVKNHSHCLQSRRGDATQTEMQF